ncbi:Potassium/sodium hyperpolarization-activated cyclic nucleotide-gated channel, partial [Globisporangium splendens]
MKATILFSKPTKVHDLRSSHASSPSSRKVTPGPPVVTDEANGGPTAIVDVRSGTEADNQAACAEAETRARKTEERAAFFYDNSRSLAERMPSLRSILRGAAAKKTAPSPRRSSHVSASRRVFRDYGSGQYQRELDNVVSYRWVIMPRAPWKVRWDLWISVIIFYSVVLIPYRIGFGIDVEYWGQVLNYLFDASFAVDVVFNFFTDFYDADIFIHELPKIRERYIKSWFLFDLVSTIPFDQFLQVVSSASSSLLTLKLLRTIRLFRLLKLMRLLRLKRAIETIQMDALNAHVLQTIKSLLMIIFIIHLVSCGWYLFYTWDPTGVNWVTYFSEGGLKYPYLVSFYWVSNTMMSIGYGDIYGVTDGERIYSILVECLGSICVGMIIANIQMLTENYNPRGIKLKQKLQETKEFLLKRDIPRRLRQRVISQFEYHWSNRTVFDEDQLLRQFPVSLQYEILAASMEPFVKRFPFFGVTSVEFFVFAIPRLRPIVLGPSQTLVDAESVWEELHFITNGTVESVRANIIVGSLAPGDICGIEYLVADRRRYTHSYRSTLKTELYAMYSADLIESIKKCPIAHKYLMDLATILSERYAESARRGRRALQRQETLRRIQEPSSGASCGEPFLQYRHRKSISFSNINAYDMDNLRRLSIFSADEIKTHWSVIRHYSKLRMVWDVLIGIMVAMTAITVPFRISFDIQDTIFLVATDRMSDACFMVDIMLSFLTTYVDETGVEIADRHEIRRHYLKTNFLVDVISTIPFDFFVEALTQQRIFGRSSFSARSSW